MLFMVGIGQSFKEVGVAPNAANVFGWTGSLTLKTNRISLLCFGTETSLEDDLVLPVVPEIILVDKTKSLAVVGHDVADLRDCRIDSAEVFEPIIE